MWRPTMGEKVWRLFERVLFFFLVKVLHLSFLEKRWDNFIQFVKFGVVGMSNTFISYFTYLIAITLGVFYLLASILGFVVSVINSFYWNNKYVFADQGGKHRSLWKSFCKTFIAYAGTGLVLNNILLYFQVGILGWSEVIAPLVNLLITIPLNFLLNKLWAFKSK